MKKSVGQKRMDHQGVPWDQAGKILTPPDAAFNIEFFLFE